MSLTSTRRVKSRSSPQHRLTAGRLLMLGFVAAGAFGTIVLETSFSADLIVDRLATFERSLPTTFSKSMAAIVPSVTIKAPAATEESKIAAAMGQPQKIATPMEQPQKVAAAVEQPLEVTASASKLSARTEPTAALPQLDASKTAPSVAPTAGRGIGSSVFEIGDKLKIAFYEQVDLQDDRWAKARS